MSAFPVKGQTVPLRYSPQARQRVNIGVGWDIVEVMAKKPEAYVPQPVTEKGINERNSGLPEEENPYVDTIRPEIGHVTHVFDADLIALIFDEKRELVDAVSPLPEENVDRSSKIYHSGDERAGVSGDDDEVISVELKDLPDYIHHIVFLVTAQSGHDFAQIVNPQARIVDSLSNRELLNVSMGGKAAKGMTGFIFAAISRGGETGWVLQNISEYRVDAEIGDWAAEVVPFLGA